MSDRYVFELEYKRLDGSANRENQFVIMDGGSMADFSKLTEDLVKCAPEPFRVQYVDDDDDIVSIDTEEEFKEFEKLAKQRSSKGMLIKLILNSSKPEEQLQPIISVDRREFKHNNQFQYCTEKCEAARSEYELHEQCFRKTEEIDHCCDFSKQLKCRIKDELKKEILLEMKGEMNKANQACVDLPEEDEEYEEDCDGNMINLFKRSTIKLLHTQRKLEKKEKQFEQSLEKLELKKKKLLEKVSSRANTNRNSVVTPNVGLPCIMSGIATKDSSILLKRVTVGKVFTHVWQITNDGTVSWTNVELHHTWSTPGLEPHELSLKCPPLNPGHEGQVIMKFKAPKTLGYFISYWHFFYEVGSQWQEFGHYISLSGNTKLGKTLVGPKMSDGNKKLKQQTTVTFNEQAEKGATEPIVSNVKPDITRRAQRANEKNFEASLASAEIAADMAREAANAAIRHAVAANTKASEIDKLNKCTEEVAEAVQGLNLLDTGSDTEAYIDPNEDTDPGFVIIDVPNCFLPEKITSQVKKQNDENIAPPEMLNKGSEVNDKMTNNAILLSDDKINDVEGINQPDPKDCSNIDVPFTEKYEYAQQEPQQQIPFPRLDPNVSTYPAFPPPRVTMAVYPPQHTITRQHTQTPHGYPLFPTQNSSSHALVWPPLPPMVHFTTPKMTPHVHYPPIPAYPPMPVSSPPLISPALPPPSAMAPQTQMPPQINNTTMPPLQMMQPFLNIHSPMHLAGQNTPTTAISTESNTTSKSDSNTQFAVTNTLGCSVNTPPDMGNHTNQTYSVTPSMVVNSNITEEQNVTKPESAEQTEKAGDSGVRIIPQALVDGAINVAATAYSTAWNAVNNFRSKEGAAVEFDPVFENNMAFLIEMGFNNVERNAILLKKFNNDVSHVIGIICATGGGAESFN